MNREVNIGNGQLKKQPNKKLSFILKDGSVTTNKLGVDVMSLITHAEDMDYYLYQNPLPWFELDKNTGELCAYWADDGSIHDFGMDEDTGEIWVEIEDDFQTVI